MTMAAGAAGFIPASYVASFPVFLGALILLAAGMTTVQVAANPYVTIIGPSSTASSRLNLAQAFNSVGTFIAPFVGGMFILRGAPQIAPALLHSMTAVAQQAYRQAQASSVRLPYTGMALLLALLATALGLLRLGPSSGRTQPIHHSRTGVLTQITRQEIWHHPWLLCGAFGIFTYVGAEVTIGSLLVNYMGLPQVAGLSEQTAANYLMFYWGGAMIGRFIGSAILQRVNTGLLLCMVAVGASALVLTSILNSGRLAMDAMLGVGFFNSIMFPSIFTLGIQDLGPLTSKGSSLMIASIAGGALIPLGTGRLADVRPENCWNDCLKEEKEKEKNHYQTLRAIAGSLRGRSGAATNRSKPSDNVPIPSRVASKPRGDGASTSTMWRGPRLDSKVRIYECS
jgi:MFS transporter, FHS family, L-fucose permease